MCREIGIAGEPEKAGEDLTKTNILEGFPFHCQERDYRLLWNMIIGSIDFAR